MTAEKAKTGAVTAVRSGSTTCVAEHTELEEARRKSWAQSGGTEKGENQFDDHEMPDSDQMPTVQTRKGEWDFPRSSDEWQQP